MAEKRVYMVHKGKKAVITYNQRKALAFAKREHASVRSMSWGLYQDSSSWDMPTFYALSDPVASFQEGR